MGAQGGEEVCGDDTAEVEEQAFIAGHVSCNHQPAAWYEPARIRGRPRRDAVRSAPRLA
jgi:hypothetical protein